jgi:hypothetical protein
VSLTHHISPFEIGKFEVTYELWYTVRTWDRDMGILLLMGQRG